MMFNDTTEKCIDNLSDNLRQAELMHQHDQNIYNSDLVASTNDFKHFKKYLAGTCVI